MRIRSIKPEFFKHDGIAELPPLVRLLFVGLWTIADCAGRLEDRPARIKVEVLPYDSIDINKALESLRIAGFIYRYERDGIKLIEIPAFKRHQRITGKEAESQSRFPGYDLDDDKEAFEKQPGNIRETPETTGDGRETEGKGNDIPASPDHAESIYSLYPRKEAKQAALKDIRLALKGKDAAFLTDRVQAYAKAVSAWPTDERQFIPHPATWFNRGSYDDDPETWRRHLNGTSPAPPKPRPIPPEPPNWRAIFAYCYPTASILDDHRKWEDLPSDQRNLVLRTLKENGTRATP